MIRYLGDFFRGDLEAIDLIVYILSMCFVVFCATPLHEYAHALIAVKLGDDTPRLRGRLTISPMAHVDAIGALMIFLFGFGYAKPVEVRMRHFKKPKRDMALVALAGPVSNFIQAFVFMFVFSGVSAFYHKTGNEALYYLSVFFFFAATINVNLGVFNFIPIPPLDGSRIATALLPNKIYFKIMQYERYIMIGLWILLFTGILTTPLSVVSSFIISAFAIVTKLPFAFIG